MRKIFYILSFSLLIIFTGCKTNLSLRCPDIASGKSHHAVWAKATHLKNHSTTPAPDHDSKTASAAKSGATASTDKGPTPFELKIPRFATTKMTNEDLAGIDSVFEKYSASAVKMERNEKGKLYIKANSNKDVFKLIKTLAAFKKTDPAAADGETGGRIALAGGIIGIIAIVLALGPFVSYGAFLLGVVAIILGAVGLRSSRRGWAIAGIVLGVLAILFAGIFGVGVYTIVLHL